MQTSKWICIQKNYDVNRKYTKCLLEDTTTGERKWVDKEDLKRAIKTKRIKVLNLDVNAANRLIEVSGINTDTSKRGQEIIDNAVLNITEKVRQKNKEIYIKSRRNKLNSKNGIIASSYMEFRFRNSVYAVNIHMLQNGSYVVQDKNREESFYYIDEIVNDIVKKVLYMIYRGEIL